MKLVLCCGVFDIPHVGHVRHLEAARAMGDKLLVCVTPDFYVRKGNGRPLFTIEHRLEVLNQLRCVDLAFEGSGSNAVEAILLLKPALYVKGPRADGEPWSEGLNAEAEAVKTVGGLLAFTDDPRIFSSTETLRKVMAYG